jgi:hypothetical protein
MEFGAFEDRARVDAGWDDDVVVLIDLTAESELEVDGNRGDDLLATTVEVNDDSFEEVVTEFDASPLLEDLGQELAQRLGLDPDEVVLETVTDAADIILEFVEQQLDHSGAPLAADVDQDGDVDAADLTIVIINWTRWWDPPWRDAIPGDIDCDGDVDSADLTILITQWTGDSEDNDVAP